MSITADELLSGEEHTQTKVEQAQSLILSMLKGSRTCRSSDIEKAAADQGISARTLRMAKQQLAGRIKMYREGTQWMVELKE